MKISGKRQMAYKAAASILATISMSNVARAYVPAVPSNDTTTLIAADDFIQINWLPMGTSAYKDALSRQLANNQGPAVAGYRGALVHFADANATEASDAPWIALISCDDSTGSPSGQGAQLQIDTVTLAMRAGAETAILYSLSAQTCLLGSDFIAGNNGTLDLYVTASQSSADAIIRQFSNAAPETYWFNSTALDNSKASVQSQISSMGGLPSATTDPSLFGPTDASTSAAAAPTLGRTGDGQSFNYLIATVANSNANSSDGTISSQPQDQNNGGSGANTGLAMIILYAITGCVTLLFLIVIMSGAIRAMRHPERYGPRARTSRPGDSGQSRIGGLSQAILDTFPVVKFLSGQNKNNGTGATGGTDRQSEESDNRSLKDIETGTIEHVSTTTNRDGITEEVVNVPMHALGASRHSGSQPDLHAHAAHETAAASTSNVTSNGAATAAGAAAATGSSEALPAANPEEEQVDSAVTCPICLLDFEDGDDIRVLPCDSRHRFHDACVVPWLLNVSSLCPLCRLDLAKDREAPTTGETGDAATEGAAATDTTAPERPSNRPRASTILSASFRQFLPSTNANANAGNGSGNGSRQSRQQQNSSDAAGDAGLEGLAAQTTEDGQQGQGAPTRTRFLRYVEQRRQRVRARGLSRSEPSTTTTTTTGAATSINTGPSTT